MKLCIAIPALNEEKTIAEAIESIPKSFKGISKITIIVIDDGSTDRTAEIAESKGAIVIKHKKNLGVGASFQDGLAKAIDLQTN
ncbi:glycosyltransferase family 2 protein, partial [Candidatus Gracilibacteria bacterium]|nr:glycosyltransferase family 2 protein [Candidatus Gracilibacteria bacterium]